LSTERTGNILVALLLTFCQRGFQWVIIFIEEHRWGRKMTARLGEANKRVIEGIRDVMSTVTDCMKSLVQFYPKHIEKEDRHFFIPCMEYFTETERKAILGEEWEFDKNLIHEKDKNWVIAVEEELTSRTP
jgi:hemerythrin-like domain-containing protein